MCIGDLCMGRGLGLTVTKVVFEYDVAFWGFFCCHVD